MLINEIIYFKVHKTCNNRTTNKNLFCISWFSLAYFVPSMTAFLYVDIHNWRFMYVKILKNIRTKLICFSTYFSIIKFYMQFHIYFWKHSTNYELLCFRIRYEIICLIRINDICNFTDPQRAYITHDYSYTLFDILAGVCYYDLPRSFTENVLLEHLRKYL